VFYFRGFSFHEGGFEFVARVYVCVRVCEREKERERERECVS